MTAANIFDLVMLGLLLAVAVGYARRGFVAGLVQFAGNLVSLFGAIFLSNRVAPVLFEQFFQHSFVERVEKLLSAEGVVTASEVVEMYAGFLPQSLKDSLISGAEELLGHVGTAPELAARLVDGVIAPLLTPIIAIVVFFLAFALCRMLVSFVVAVLTNLNRIPLVGGVNRVLGWVMGFLAGAVDLYLVLCGVWALIVITGGSIGFLNEAALEGSIAYSIFKPINPFY